MSNLTEKIQLALKFHKEGEFVKALAQYERVFPDLAATATKCSLLNNAGALALSLRQPEKAYQFFLESHKITTDLSSENLTLLSQNEFNLAVVLSEHLNDPTRALSHGLRAIKSAPKVAKYHQLVGNILQNLNREEMSRKYFLTASQLSAEENEKDSAKTPVESPVIQDWKEKMVSKYQGKASEKVIVLSEKPLILYLADLLTTEECDEIIKEASPQLKSSFVTGFVKEIHSQSPDDSVSTATPSAAATQAAYRSSKQAWLTPSSSFQLPLELLERLSSVLSIQLPYLKLHSEKLQVVKYGEGQQFKIHHDSSPFQKRLFTALVYLSDDQESLREEEEVLQNSESKKFSGGETWFPYASVSKPENIPEDVLSQLVVNPPLSLGTTKDHETAILTSLNHYEEEILNLKNSQSKDLSDVCPSGEQTSVSSLLAGISVKPKKGSLIIFVNHNKENELDPLAVHAGLPVIQAKSSGGEETQREVEKWIANYWVGINSESLSDALQ